MQQEFEDAFDRNTKVWQVYLVLKDRQWHCRECEYPHVQTTQIAGGSGIQGLQRGNRKRLGMDIESGNHFCVKCGRQTRQDRWNGQFVDAVSAPSMPSEFSRRAIQVLGSRDVVEGTRRPPNQLTVDHKLPMLRWDKSSSSQQSNYAEMSDDDIVDKFQWLKASNGSVSHNLLKSRACERCFRDGQRGTPFGITFFYDGGSTWKPADKQDPSGCVGCGWYDFDNWRKSLNRQIQHMKKSGHEPQ